MSAQARENLRAAVPVRTLLEAVMQMLRQVLSCLGTAARFGDSTVLDFGCLVIGCLSKSVDGPCPHNQTLLVEEGIPALLMEVIGLSYRPFEPAGEAFAPSQMPDKINKSLAAIKVAAGNLLHLLSVGSSDCYTQRVASDEMGVCSTRDAPTLVPILTLLQGQIDCSLLVRQAAVNASLLKLGASEKKGAASPAAGGAHGSAQGLVAGAIGMKHVALGIEDVGLESRRGRELLQEELSNYLVVLRCLEHEASAMSQASAPALASSSDLPPGSLLWEGPSNALQQMQRQSPRLWAFASERVRCVEIIAAARPQEQDGGVHAAAGLPGAKDSRGVLEMPASAHRRIVLWFVLSDHLAVWNSCGGTAAAGELTWDALHQMGGRGGSLTHGVALLRCWDECCRRFLTWRALRGAKGFVGGVAPGAPPETAALGGGDTGVAQEAHTVPAVPRVGGAEVVQGGRMSPARGAKSPASTRKSPALTASGLSSHGSSKSRRKVGRVSGVGAVERRSVAEGLCMIDGLPCAISLLVALIFTAAYGVPSAEPGSGLGVEAGGNGALYEGRYNVTAEVLAWGRAGAMLGSERWQVPTDVLLKAYDPWRFAPWAQIILRVLAALHVFAMACEIASWLLSEWPVIFLRVASEERLARLALRGEPWRRRRPSKGVRGTQLPPCQMDVPYMDLRMLVRLLAASATPYYLLVLGIFSLLGAVHSPMFLLAHLVRLLAPLSRAARLAGPQLARTGGIALAALVCYALFAYTYFSNKVNAVKGSCHSPWQCVSAMVLAALARDNYIMAHDAQDFAETPPFFAASSWDQFHSLYSATFLIMWGFLLQGALFAHILDAFAQLRQLDEARQRDCEHTDLFTGRPRRAPRGSGARAAALVGRQQAVGKEGAGSLGPVTFDSDPHSPASWVLFLCWASEQVRGSRWALVDEVVSQFVGGDPGFLPVASES